MQCEALPAAHVTFEEYHMANLRIEAVSCVG